MSLDIRLGVFGLGTVGTGLVRLINSRRQHLLSSLGIRLEISGAAVQNLNKPRPSDLADISLVSDPLDLVRSQHVDIVVELMGGIEPALSVVREAIMSGTPVVTANKALLAEHGRELVPLAAKMGVPLLAEASVGGGIPILKILREGLVANEITSLTGIVNGTTNYILTRMDEDGVTYFEALRKASDLGYAEADPGLDVDGVDARHKLQILAAHMCEGIYPEGEILQQGIADVTDRDFFYAKKRDMTIKLLAIAVRHPGGIELRVHPTLVPRVHPLAAVRDQFNAIMLEGDAVGNMMLYGAGAGAMPTASSVYADIVDIAAKTVRTGIKRNGGSAKPLSVLREDMIESAYYLRVTVEDKPGIIGEIATILGRHDISVSSVTAELIPNADGLGDVEIIAHRTREKTIRDALAVVDKLPRVRGRTRTMNIIDGS